MSYRPARPVFALSPSPGTYKCPGRLGDTPGRVSWARLGEAWASLGDTNLGDSLGEGGIAQVS
jgi:hypothetical protein